MRKQLSRRTRFEVFKRDGFRCRYCGATPQELPLHVDHVVPVAGGGTELHIIGEDIERLEKWFNEWPSDGSEEE